MRNLLFLLPLAYFISNATAADEAFPGIEKLMSSEEFKAAGLDKLSEAERTALNAWLLHYTATEAPTMLITNEDVKEVEAKHVIQANVKPPFKGWDGNTVFYLDNGQVWRQRLNGRVVYQGEDTAVEIKKNFLGFYKLYHVASGRSIGVSRVK
ncbi:hypothetical protein [Pseudohalioglobus lutimaris]|uniref:Uncharacterized protein n=1 Tax=Pseudohalioglobus lutimaris TaxID=1737061 RepID=A0A2N5X8I4_9GAMM|nr:hypothetical protein [Pseudohalioglobus lutimaris]PLW70801.1 hypothetical protein C0039_01325 [Pseudohalioglobus lutimaris]